jgi:hypothetical protein
VSIINYDALREQVRNTYANPPPDIIAEMVKETGDTSLVEVQKIYADAMAEMAVATMKCIERKVNGEALITVITMASISSLRNLIDRVTPASQKAIRQRAAEHFAAGLDPDVEFVQDGRDPMPLNQ